MEKISVKRDGKKALDTQTQKKLIAIAENHQPEKTASRSMEERTPLLFAGGNNTKRKTAAIVLAEMLNRDVYRIDLSAIVSKYIGETEKNLEKIFGAAAHKDWILFFDEADALFEKRTDVKDAHDKYANQEIAYLLQLMRDYKGIVILSKNENAAVDDHFTTVITFPEDDDD